MGKTMIFYNASYSSSLLLDMLVLQSKFLWSYVLDGVQHKINILITKQIQKLTKEWNNMSASSMGIP